MRPSRHETEINGGKSQLAVEKLAVSDENLNSERENRKLDEPDRGFGERP